MKFCQEKSIGVDIPEDLAKAKKILKRQEGRA